ncbi:MAG: hypothetical protein KAH38_12500 [Candidatus Hydrogenedentes bacterium]|nr:hypothetical protein [Candidatus Hydrogenedentota bacterium]
MADDKLFGDDALENGSDNSDGDSNLGNLPPLSDFDSQGEGDAGDALPPLGDFESHDDSGSETFSPLQEDKEFAPVTPEIGVGNVHPTGGEDIGLPAFDSGAFDDGVADDDDQIMSAGGFQDLAADSDFSPETPDIGPGPDSALDTPIFDSAFGGEDSGFSGADSGFGGGQTGAPTQAMESPMFDDFGAESDFATPELAATPVPDFSADTGFGDDDFAGGEPAAVGAGVGAMPPAMPAPGGGSQGAGTKSAGVNWMVLGAFVVVSLIIGVFNAPYVSEYLTFLPNPQRDEVDKLTAELKQEKSTVASLRNLGAGGDGAPEITQSELDQLIKDIEASKQELGNVKGQLDSTRAILDGQQQDLGTVERSIREKNDEIISAREFLEELRNEAAIVQARQRGLIAEVDRLTGHVGELEEANVRRVAAKDALAHNVDRLVIQIKESIPLAPQKFDYTQRLADVVALREKVNQALWVSPELQNEYASVYLREMELARASEYFFANVAVTDRYGARSLKWAECLMRGNWAVYYRTLDGANIGSFENVGTQDVPQWGFREDMPEGVQQSIEAHIVNSRIPDFAGQAQLLAERELANQEGTSWQRTYSSL